MDPCFLMGSPIILMGSPIILMGRVSLVPCLWITRHVLVSNQSIIESRMSFPA